MMNGKIISRCGSRLSGLHLSVQSVQTLIELSKSKTLISSSETATQLVNKFTPYMESHFHGRVHISPPLIHLMIKVILVEV